MTSRTATPYANGHVRDKAYGDTMYRGPLAHLPPPRPLPSPEEGAEAMHGDGFVQFPDLLAADQVRELRAWMDGLGGDDRQYQVEHWCFNKHLDADLRHDPRWLELIDRSPAYEVLALILGHDFIVTGGSLWVTGAGRAMNMHLDQLAIALPEDVHADPRVRVPIQSGTLHYYLDDQVEELGPTLIVPGSHRAGRPPRDESSWNGVQPRMISVAAGGAVLFRHDLWHGAAMNRSGRRRYLIQVHYGEHRRRLPGPPITEAERWSPEVVSRATERQRLLLGGGPTRTSY